MHKRALGASIYNIWFMLKTPGENGEILRFLGEATDFFQQVFNLNSFFTILSIFLLFIFIFRKKEISFVTLSIVTLLYIGVLVKLLTTLELSINPMIEGHFRTIPCWALHIIFLGMYLRDVFFKEINTVKFTNFILIALFTCIFQTIWQNVNTFYWDKNIQYLKLELQKENSYLYIPSEHEEISSFHNKYLRKYIWHSVYTATSIVLAEEYAPKTILMTHDIQTEPGNLTFRKALFSDLEHGKISIPFGTLVDIKNKFWDLTNVAKALDDYNKENNIETYR